MCTLYREVDTGAEAADYSSDPSKVKECIYILLRDFINSIDYDGCNTYDVRTVKKLVKEDNCFNYEYLKEIIYKTVITLMKGQTNQPYLFIDSYFFQLSKKLGNDDHMNTYKNLLTKNKYLNFDIEYIENRCSKCNIFNSYPTITTVHSVKGETHDATLFLETFYNRSFESDILKDVICGKRISDIIAEQKELAYKLENTISGMIASGKSYGLKTRKKERKQILSNIDKLKQYSKLVYVALTRSKGPVGYAISRSRFEENLEEHINSDEWNIISV